MVYCPASQYMLYYSPDVITFYWSKTMRIKSVVGLLSLVLICSLCLYGMGTGGENSSNGIFMKISGKVIQRETGQGVPDVNVDIINICA